MDLRQSSRYADLIFHEKGLQQPTKELRVMTNFSGQAVPEPSEKTFRTPEDTYYNVLYRLLWEAEDGISPE